MRKLREGNKKTLKRIDIDFQDRLMTQETSSLNAGSWEVEEFASKFILF